MVPTRASQTKYSNGELVLCYEPDPSKVRVLYDAKVLDTLVSHVHGKRIIKYKVHFQGWSSSWDRIVDEDALLKDGEDNRDLQKELFQKAKDVIGERRLKWHHQRRLGEESGDSEMSSLKSEVECSDDETSDEEVYEKAPASVEVPLELPQDLKQILEKDWLYITHQKKLLVLPSDPNAVAVMESYMDYVVNKRFHLTAHSTYAQEKDAIAFYRLAMETMESLRVCLDFYIEKCLMYKEEQEQTKNLKELGSLNGEKKLILPTEVASPAYYKEVPVNPSLIYGPVHLLRLMVKLPDILGQTVLDRRRQPYVIQHLKEFLKYLHQEKDHFFGPFLYTDSLSAE
ncbi:unnamed protein product [Darwinula stevensoni]|uniref:Protein male-specific lethal-3 n=1 Tax=Darwinula stevensoni TaxID=69355 RepID=A0A7R8XBQ5_9CRUS|nr:unnamed protein product [Darwinula stevensoni]CAG0891448.1 unnamed protein product [Darwinula stevensoni]